ncbi:MAG: PKD domain-containing protein, partial [Chloroflexota bacterium]
AAGNTSEATETITVTQGLQAAFTSSVTSGTAPLTVNFDASGSQGEISSFNWDFGDGNSSTGVTPQNIYSSAGDFTVILTISDVGGNTSQSTALISVSAVQVPAPNPQIAFISERDGNREVYVMNADGTNQVRITNNGAQDSQPDWSGNDELAFVRDGSIHVASSDGSNERVLSADGGTTPLAGNFPRWSPDSSRILFTSEQDGNSEVYVINADGSGQTRLTTSDTEDTQADWSPDGSRILFVSARDGNREIYVMNADGTNPVRLTTSDTDDVQPAFSPDGTLVAFASDRDGNREIYVMNADGTNQVRITNNGATDAQVAWTTDGRLLFASERDGNREIYVMNVDGTNLTRLTENGVFDTQPTFKP